MYVVSVNWYGHWTTHLSQKRQ